MNILAIETSCDETAIAILSVSGKKNPIFRLRANLVHSQIAIHAPYGGVFPALAKREHIRNLVPVLKEALAQGFGISKSKFLISKKFPNSKIKLLTSILEREPELLEQFLKDIRHIKKPRINAIAVTYGPGLEPALWVGINFAKALSLVWDVPIIPVNHMEGHLFSSFIRGSKFKIQNSKFPMLALLVSGGHTELILIKKWGSYKKIGETQDDAAGEAFDKVARMLGLSYPGGPEIARLASQHSAPNPTRFAVSSARRAPYPLPRPMINSKDLNFSFSGLKTAVLYLLRDLSKKHSNVLQNTEITQSIAHEFQEAVVDVLVAKTIKAAQKYKVRAILLGGGVAANERLRARLSDEVARALPHVKVLLPDRAATTDNAAMIAVAGYFNSQSKKRSPKNIRAQGSLSL